MFCTWAEMLQLVMLDAFPASSAPYTPDTLFWLLRKAYVGYAAAARDHVTLFVSTIEWRPR